MESGHRSDRDRFRAVLSINIFVFIAELLAGYQSGSLSMISDSFHVLLHIFASLAALVSEYEFMGIKPEKIKFWSAGANISLFFPLAFIIAYEANERFKNPPILDLTSVFFFVAILGLIANLYTIFILKPDHHEECSGNQNRFILYIHMTYDAIGSIIVIAGGVIIRRTNFYWLDPATSFMLAGFIVVGAIIMSRNLFHGHSHIH